MFHDACRCITVVCYTVKVTLFAFSWLGCDFPEGYPMTITVFRHKICHKIWLITKRPKLAWMSEAASVDGKKSVSRRLSRSRSQHEGRFTEISRQRATSVAPAVSDWSCNFDPVRLLRLIIGFVISYVHQENMFQAGFLFLWPTHGHAHLVQVLLLSIKTTPRYLPPSSSTWWPCQETDFWWQQWIWTRVECI